MKLKTLLMLAASAGAMASASTSAEAGAFGLRTQSTNALGMAWAGTASGAPGVSSIFWNPATLTMNPGYTSEYNVSYAVPDVRVKPIAPTPTIGLGGSGDIGQDSAIPASYTSYQLTDRIWLGLANASQFGSITKPNDVWAGQAYSRSSRLTTLSFTPMVGFKLSDMVSFGIGPTIEYLHVRLNSAAGVAPTSNSVLLEGKDWSAGFTTGVTITPFQGTTIGVGYRSSVRHELEGTFRVPSAASPAGSVTPVRVGLNLPERLTVGLTQAVTPDLKVSAGFEWMNWSRLGTPAILAEATGSPVRPFPLNYKDGYIYSLGAEYQMTRDLAVRAGVGYEQSPINDNNRSTRLPDTDRIYASIGASYDWSEMVRISAAYSHYFSTGDHAIRIAPGNPQYVGVPFYATTDPSVNVFSMSVRLRWDDPSRAAPAAVVARY